MCRLHTVDARPLHFDREESPVVRSILVERPHCRVGRTLSLPEPREGQTISCGCIATVFTVPYNAASPHVCVRRCMDANEAVSHYRGGEGLIGVRAGKSIDHGEWSASSSPEP